MLKESLERWRKNVQRRITEKATSRVNLWSELASVDNDTKTRLLPRVQTAQERLAVAEVWNDNLSVATIAGVLLLALVAAKRTVDPARLADHWLHVHYADSNWSTVAILVGSAFMVALFLLPPLLLKGAHEYIQFPRLAIAAHFTLVLGCAGTVYALAARTHHGAVAFVTAAGMLFVVLIMAVTYVMLLLSLPVLLALERRKQVYCFDAALLHDLLRTLWIIERDPDGWAEMKFRRNIASLLEGAASNLEKYLPAQMRTGDAAGDAWLETTAEQIAAVIRNLNKHLAVPAEHSREMVMDRLAFNLTRLAAGDWNAMDRMTPQGVSRRRTWRGRVTLAVQTTISAGIPIVVLIGIRQKWLAIPEAFAAYVTLALVVWAAVALLRAFDPFFESNLGLLEKFIPLLRGKGKD